MAVQAEPVRRRAPRFNAQFTRAALGVVRPINRQIGEWQARVALLEALSIHSPGPPRPDLAEQARRLREVVEAQQEAFASEVAALPREVATESRIADTGKALGTVISGVQRVLGLLEARA